MAIVYLSLGSNLGDRYQNIKKAVAGLNSVSKILSVSSIYLTSPVENTNQPWFYNCVIKISTKLSPKKLFETIKQIEDFMGRKRNGRRYQARIIDIDIIFYGKKVIRTNSLSIPHIKAHKRAFVLYPMNEISPNFVHPAIHKRISTLKNFLNDRSQKVKMIIPSSRFYSDINCE